MSAGCALFTIGAQVHVFNWGYSAIAARGYNRGFVSEFRTERYSVMVFVVCAVDGACGRFELRALSVFW